MKILIHGINYYPELVGISKYTTELAQHLSSDSHTVVVVTTYPYFPSWKSPITTKPLYSKESIDGVTIYRCPCWIPSNPSGLKRILHYISFALSSLPVVLWQASKANLAISIAPSLFFVPALLLSTIFNTRLRIWLHIQDFEVEAAFKLSLLRNTFLLNVALLLEYYLISRFDRVSTISPSMMKKLHSKNIPSSKTYFLPNWVDLSSFELGPHLNHYRGLRSQLDIPDDWTIALYSGSMSNKQDFSLLVEAINLSAQAHSKIAWVLVGDGPLKAFLKQQTQYISSVYHLPLVPTRDLPNLLVSADLHLLPQKDETSELVLPSKLLSMLASRKPIVACASPLSDISSIVRLSGLVTPPGDAYSFYRAVLHLSANPQLRDKYGDAGRHYADSHYSKDTILNHLSSHIRAFVGI